MVMVMLVVVVVLLLSLCRRSVRRAGCHPGRRPGLANGCRRLWPCPTQQDLELFDARDALTTTAWVRCTVLLQVVTCKLDCLQVEAGVAQVAC